MHQKAGWRDADLTGVAILGCDESRCCGIQIGVVGDDYGAVTAEFHRDALHVLTGEGGELLAYRH